MCKTPAGYQYQHLKRQVISFGVSNRDVLWEDMKEHVNKSDMSYEGLLTFWANAKSDTVILRGAGNFIVFLTRFFVGQPIVVIKPLIKKKAKKEQDNDYTYQKFFANDADSLLDNSEFEMVLVYNG